MRAYPWRRADRELRPLNAEYLVRAFGCPTHPASGPLWAWSGLAALSCSGWAGAPWSRGHHLGSFVAFTVWPTWRGPRWRWLDLAIVRRGMTSRSGSRGPGLGARASTGRPAPVAAAPAAPSPGALSSGASRFPTPTVSPRCATSRSRSRRGAWWRWWGRRAAASPPWARWSAGSTSRRAAPCSWAEWTCATCPPLRCAGASATSRRRRFSSPDRCGTISASRTTAHPTSGCARRRSPPA